MTDARGSWQRARNDTKKKERKKKKEEMSKDRGRERERSSRERTGGILYSLSCTGWNDEDGDTPVMPG